MNTRILNRDFEHPADGWYDIEVPGTHPNARAGIVQIIDAKAVDSIVNTFNREAESTPNFPGMLIDIEHFKHQEDQETRAYGWLMSLRNKGGCPQGQIRWSGIGQKAVDNGEYRFFSSEYDPAQMEVVRNGKPRQLRPMRLDGLTLTNVPNNKGQKPITNRRNMETQEDDVTVEDIRKLLNGGPGSGPRKGGGSHTNDAERAESERPAKEATAAANEASAKAQSETEHREAANLHETAAGASADIGDNAQRDKHIAQSNLHSEIANKMRQARMGIHNRQFPTGSAGTEHQHNATDLDMKTVIAELKLPADASETDVLAAVKKITNRVTELETAVIDADLETYQDRFDPKQKEFIRAALVTNRAGTIDFLKAQPQTKRPVAPDKIHNRAAASAVDHAVGGDEETLSAKRNEAIDNYKVTNRCTYEAAYNAVRRKSPELFGVTSKK